LKPIGPESALAVLRLQHAIVDRQERLGVTTASDMNRCES